MQQCDFPVSDQEFQQKADEIWSELIINRTPVVHPTGAVLGGQPGAGKSKLIKLCAENMAYNIVVINADTFRQEHPYFKQIQQKYGSDYPSYTAQFSGKMAEEIFKRAVEQHYNLVIEGTFRTADVPIATLQKLKNAGYKTAVYIQTTAKEISWQSTIKRAESEALNGKTARYVDKSHHDNVVHALAENAEQVLQSQLADYFAVYSREKKLFDAEKDAPELLKNSINQELGLI